ncbi:MULTISPECIES: thiolase family protein [Arthrobacter]|uniref:Thiolase family protein n=2 Tax=Arthrobacter TaxID=1663 RepID=A0ABU9KFZ0_9MICC|nr:thiolase family protein [Arthrobacter sp. YJM1]MDP5225804.1 thiolase family protein [Arthrobacter sp. YJM1]
MSLLSANPVDDRTPVIVAALRTPLCRTGGALAGLTADELLAPVLSGLLESSRLDGSAVDEVLAGNAVAAGGNVARQAALAAGLPASVAALTLDRQCTSGLDAVIHAARLIQAGAGDVYLAGGTESISTAPQRAERLPDGSTRPYSRARFTPRGAADPEMGAAAENVAAHCGITREAQDAFAARSHERAVQAVESGTFSAETIPMPGAPRAHDDGPRATLDTRLLSRFRPVFRDGGTVTAGNSCQDVDGAAAVLLTTRARARALGFTSGLLFEQAASAGVEPELLGLGAVAAARKLPDEVLSRPGLVEFNEAFAAQTLACLEGLGIDPATANRDGGALALGHAYGASGAVLVVRLFHQARRLGVDGHSALALISGAGGQGVAASFRWSASL